MAHRTAVLAAGVVLCLSTSVAIGPGAQAASGPSPSAQPSTTTTYPKVASKFSLTISPTRLTVSPADIGSLQKVLVINQGEAALNVTVQKRNFVAKPDGSLGYQETAPYSASTWLTISPPQFTTAAG